MTALILLVCTFVQGGIHIVGPRYIQHLDAAVPDEATGGGQGEFYTHLPLLRIDTGGQEIPGEGRKEGETDCRVEIWDREGVYHKLSDAPDLSLEGSIKIRGNSSRDFDKKGYKITFTDGSGEGMEVSVAGLAADDEWVLNGPFLDKTLMRNYLSYNLAGLMMDYAPGVRYCEVVLNDEYEGIYLLVEKIGRAGDKIDITGINRFLDITGYILQLDVRGKHRDREINNYSFYSYYLPGPFSFSVDYPGVSKLTPELLDYVEKDISQIERALYTYDYEDPFFGYRAKLDTETFIDYFLINEFSGNVDAMRKSTYLYKSPGSRLKICVWDFNNAFDNYIDYPLTAEGFYLTDRPFYRMLLRDRRFVDALIARYHKLRRGVLAQSYLDQLIDGTRSYLGPAIERNFEVWGYSFDTALLDGNNKLYPDSRNPQSYDEAVEDLKTFIHERLLWMDAHIDVLYQYCADSANINYSN